MRPVLALLVTCLGCGHPAPTAPPPPTGPAALDAMDPRQPLPLLPMMALHQKEQMRSHLEAIEGVVTHLATRDWAAVEAASLRLGTSPSMAQTCEHMGAAAPAFTEAALRFHRTADTITAAARAQDADAVLRATSATLTACTTCHAAWRQQVLSPDDHAAAVLAVGPPRR
jgi:hypothetical protein